MADTPVSQQRSFARWWREHWHRALPWIVLGSLLLAVGILWLTVPGFRHELRAIYEVFRSGDQERISAYLHRYDPYGPVVSVGLLILQAVFAPIPATILQLVNGAIYGVWQGALLNLIGQTGGATIAFLLARSLGGGVVERLAGKAHHEGFASWLERYGARALFVIRAVPSMPSDYMSYFAGLTSMPFRTYLIATFLGFVPQSIAYAWLGQDAIRYFWWIMGAGLVMAGLIAGGTYLYNRRRRPAAKETPGQMSSDPVESA